MTHSHDEHSADHAHAGHEHAHADAAQSTKTETDPVCGMKVDPDAGKPSTTYKGRTYHFCSQKCHGKFETDPYFYLSGNAKAAKKSAQAGTPYTCPMHPEIVQEGPGTCPICGMALEPMPASPMSPIPNLSISRDGCGSVPALPFRC